MAIIATLTMTVSMATVCTVATDYVVDAPEAEIEYLSEDDNKEPDSNINCDQPVDEGEDGEL